VIAEKTGPPHGHGLLVLWKPAKVLVSNPVPPHQGVKVTVAGDALSWYAREPANVAEPRLKLFL
jgi:hypothetical protein